MDSPRAVLALALALTVSACEPSMPGGARPGHDGAAVVADGWPDLNAPAAPLVPWTLEAQATVVALATVREPFERGGRQILRLELGEVCKGSGVARAVFAEDAQPFLGCIPPPSMPRPSELFPPGSEVLAYLLRSEGGGLTILQVVKRPDAARLQSLRRFLVVHDALRAETPQWETVLPVAGTMDDLTRWALIHARPAGVSVPLRAMLARTLDRAASGEMPDALHVNVIAGLLVTLDPDARSLPLLERLARWVLALDDEGFRRHWPACSPAGLLQSAAADSVAGWQEVLTDILHRSKTNEDALQATAHALAFLPEDAGIPTLIGALDARQSGVVAALIAWGGRRGGAGDLRKRLREQVETLLAGPAPAGDADLTFRRQLGHLLEVLAN